MLQEVVARVLYVTTLLVLNERFQGAGRPSWTQCSRSRLFVMHPAPCQVAAFLWEKHKKPCTTPGPEPEPFVAS